VVQTIVAFVNGAGGELRIGVSDKSRQIIGADDPFALEEQLTRIIQVEESREYPFPLIKK